MDAASCGFVGFIVVIVLFLLPLWEINDMPKFPPPIYSLPPDFSTFTASPVISASAWVSGAAPFDQRAAALPRNHAIRPDAVRNSASESSIFSGGFCNASSPSALMAEDWSKSVPAGHRPKLALLSQLASSKQALANITSASNCPCLKDQTKAEILSMAEKVHLLPEADQSQADSELFDINDQLSLSIADDIIERLESNH